MLIIRTIPYPVTSTISVPQQKLLYSNTFFNNKLRTNSNFDFLFMVRINVNVILMMNKLKNSFGRPRYRFYFEYQWYMEYK